MWITIKNQRKQLALNRLRSKSHLSIGQPFSPIDIQREGRTIRFVNSTHILEQAKDLDILFFQGYSGETSKIVDVINSLGCSLVVCWFWDNHHLITETTRNAFLADYSFAAHYYASSYLRTPLLGWGGFIPLCPITWSEMKVKMFRERFFDQERSNLLYGGYNSYQQWPERDKWLNEVIESTIPTNINIYKHGQTPHPFYTLSEEDKFKEWAFHKVTLCTSFEKNTTIRMFDSLLTGSIPILTGEIADLNMIFTPDEMNMLNIIHIQEPTLDLLKNAYDLAISLYDEGGVEHAVKRSDYILQNHMPYNRVHKMVDVILQSEP